ncbi:hypothetical protein FN846DRAFT_892860 [Sphaerosporella brunnea]|uniref:Uncharacterized protein n=1 Tax=Sphaerosporella brunnea TaxID=1250544 RepID=A0A5J5EMT1_9PEZI|nr:hypothetical protein FN846DRAFT_892860 [Sphaerosporella brunnea]
MPQTILTREGPSLTRESSWWPALCVPYTTNPAPERMRNGMLTAYMMQSGKQQAHFPRQAQTKKTSSEETSRYCEEARNDGAENAANKPATAQTRPGAPSENSGGQTDTAAESPKEDQRRSGRGGQRPAGFYKAS